MRQHARPLALTLLAPLLAAALCGCPGSGSSAGGIQRVDEKALVTVITADQPATLDPHVTSNGGDVKVIVQVYQTLVRVDPDDVGTLLPELAESWQVSEDGQAVTFQIRQGVTFHDGAPLDAAACKLSLDRARKVGFELPTAPYATEFAHVTALEADGHTLTVRLDAPVARVLLRNLSMFCASIVSPQVLEASKAAGAPDAASALVSKQAAGTGPFRVDAFDPAAKVVRLVANEGYWGGAPEVKTVVFQSVTDENARTEYLTKPKGLLLVDDVPRQRWAEVEQSDAMTLHSWWALNLCYLGLNARHDTTRELEVRRAIQLAIDRAKVVEHYEGTARPTHSLVAQPMPEYDPALRPEGWSDDLAARQAKARELLEGAGAVGREVTIHFPQRARPYLPRPQDVADTLRQQLNAVGLKAQIEAVDNAKLFSSVPTGEYALVLIGWMTDNGDPDNFYSPLADGADGEASENNTSRILDPEVHGKVVAAQQLTEPAARVAAYREIERLLQERVAGYAPLVNTQQGMAYSKTLTGVEVDGLGHYRFHRVRLAQE